MPFRSLPQYLRLAFGLVQFTNIISKIIASTLIKRPPKYDRVNDIDKNGVLIVSKRKGDTLALMFRDFGYTVKQSSM